jgi:hypothetical protein
MKDVMKDLEAFEESNGFDNRTKEMHGLFLQFVRMAREFVIDNDEVANGEGDDALPIEWGKEGNIDEMIR